jgi:hypothetical protein
VASPANAERGDPPVPVLTWKACGPSNPGKLCATATVPLDYDKPAGRTTGVALAKIPASESARRIGTVFINPGGPGGSGVGYLLSGLATTWRKTWAAVSTCSRVRSARSAWMIGKRSRAT